MDLFTGTWLSATGSGAGVAQASEKMHQCVPGAGKRGYLPRDSSVQVPLRVAEVPRAANLHADDVRHDRAHGGE